MAEMHDFLSVLVLSKSFRDKFIAAMNQANPQKSVTELLEKEGFSINDDQIKDQILNLDIDAVMKQKMQDVDDFVYDNSGLDPQW
ncbi:MAG: hypothetical protein KAW12_20805 [Candidatus Aminicenantes bacterium]|nr:hypothetical protein [Candidatus Aminicenantes bacterium]